MNGYDADLRRDVDFRCHDCKIDVVDIDEYSFILLNEVWRLADPDGKREFLCVGCVEGRLGRNLTKQDFDWKIPLNSQELLRGFDRCHYRRSDRLLDRLDIKLVPKVDDIVETVNGVGVIEEIRYPQKFGSDETTYLICTAGGGFGSSRDIYGLDEFAPATAELPKQAKRDTTE